MVSLAVRRREGVQPSRSAAQKGEPVGRRRNSNSPKNRDHVFDVEDELLNEKRHTALQPRPPVAVATPKKRLLIEDRRRWDPAPQVARDVLGRTARVTHQKKTTAKSGARAAVKPLQSKRPLSMWPRLENALPRFAEARKTVICLKRKARREVMFALKRTGKGAKSPRRRNQWSDVQC